jgi:hypothetical protein
LLILKSCNAVISDRIRFWLWNLALTSLEKCEPLKTIKSIIVFLGEQIIL